MDATQTIGLMAAIFTTAANLPQTYIIIRDRSTRHVSGLTYGLLALGTGLWVIYGFIKTDWPILITNGISTATSLMILILNYTSQKVIDVVHESMIPKKIQRELKSKRKKTSK